MSGISAVGGAMPQVVSGASKQVVSGASKSMSKGHMMSQLFQQIDTSNSGSISEAQFD